MRYLTREEGMDKARELLSAYPGLTTVEDVIDRAVSDGVLERDDNLLIVWGRLLRLLPVREVA